MTAYYNEIDPYAAEWLRNLIAAGHIAPGDVDTRDIRDVRPSDLRGYTQCHFFAGVGVWSYSLRRAGWSDDRPVWTGSCPCQPFSPAGAGLGFSDERHLWPHWHWLISECRPAIILGEQVASKDADPWIDLVHDDLEALGYAVGAVPFPSAGVGAPHIRDRLYWVAHANTAGQRASPAQRRKAHRSTESAGIASASGGLGWLADTERSNCGCEASAADHIGKEAYRSTDWAGGRGSSLVGLAYSCSQRVCACGCGSAGSTSCALQGGDGQRQWVRADAGATYDAASAAAGPTNGHWRAADWLLCRDGKWRPVEPGTFPLAHGAPARVGRLRAYGNAINASAAEAFIRSVRESIE